MPETEQAGDGFKYQELNLAENLDVAANIFLGREPRKAGLIDDARMKREAGKFLEMVGLDVDPALEVGHLPIGKQQLVEIAKALSVDARVLIMDEPTSSLSQAETEQLFTVVKDLVSRGVSIVYISHRLSEIVRIADRVTVLRDGENAEDTIYRSKAVGEPPLMLGISAWLALADAAGAAGPNFADLQTPATAEEVAAAVRRAKGETA